MRSAEMRAEREHNARAWLAWHVEALRRMKRMPRLANMLVKSKRRRGPQSVEQQMHVMAAWAAKVDRAIAIREEHRWRATQ